MSVSRWALLDEIKNTPGFVSFSMSEPLKSYEFERYAWVTYNSEEECRSAKGILEDARIGDFKLNPVKS